LTSQKVAPNYKFSEVPTSTRITLREFTSLLTLTPRPLAGGEGFAALLPKNLTPSPLSALRASAFGSLGRSFVPLPVRDKISPPPLPSSQINLD